MSDADWTALPASAQRHGVTGMIAAALAERTDVPEPVGAALNHRMRENAARSLLGLSELLRIVRAFDDAGVPLVALKGPAFSQWLYGDPALRRFGDLDLLVVRGDRDRAIPVLRTLGYGLPPAMSVKTAAAIYGPLGAWPLSGDATHPVDLHWRLSHVRFPAPLTPSQILAESTFLELGGVRVRIPSPTHAALLTLLHAAKHIWCALEVLVSIARVMERDDVHWGRVRSLARAAHGWQGSAAGLQLASDILGAQLPRELQDEPWPSTPGALRQDAIEALRLPAGVFHDRWIERHAHRAAFDRWQDRLVYDFWRVVGPTPLEWQWWHLPDSLTPLYVPLRLARLGVAALRRTLGPHRVGGDERTAARRDRI